MKKLEDMTHKELVDEIKFLRMRVTGLRMDLFHKEGKHLLGNPYLERNNNSLTPEEEKELEPTWGMKK